MDKYPEYVDWDYIPPFPSTYDNDEFADLWIKHNDRINYKCKIIGNSNPKMTKLILEIIATGQAKNMPDYSKYLTNNKNPGLTDYFTTNWSTLNDSKFLNKNPKLFNLMMNDPDPNWGYLSQREEPEFAEFLIKNEEHLDLIMLARNSNPGLTDFIINIAHKLEMECLSFNKNPKLMELKKKNKDKLCWGYISACYGNELLLENLNMASWRSLSKNRNPEITETLINNPDKVDYENISRNANKKLIKFKEMHKDKLTDLYCAHSNILEIDNNFFIKFMQQLD